MTSNLVLDGVVYVVASLISPFKIKVCGIKSVRDAVAAVEFGADAIGLNFYPRSLRSIDQDEARLIVNELPKNIVRIGVFVNAEADYVRNVAEHIPLDAIQLHGDEPLYWLEGWNSPIPIIRAVRVVNQDFGHAQTEVDLWIENGAALPLLDAGSPAAYGGTGCQLDWKQVAEHFTPNVVVLAGGLDSDNVSQAIRDCCPMAVDVASGVEKYPGVKDRVAMKEFISNALHAFNLARESW